MKSLSKTERIKKLMIIKQCLYKYSSTNIYNRILEFYYIIEQEYNKFEYVYENINYINIDSYLVNIITDLNFNLITVSLNNKSILEYNSNFFDKFIYIISIAVNLNINIKIINILISKYLTKIIDYGNTYDIINVCLLSFKIKNNNKNIIINFNYYEGLIECLNLSPRWNEFILYFHNKQLISKFNIKDIFLEVTKYLITKEDDHSYNILFDLFGDKSDFIIA